MKQITNVKCMNVCVCFKFHDINMCVVYVCAVVFRFPYTLPTYYKKIDLNVKWHVKDELITIMLYILFCKIFK